jgi:hypothetical protein
MNMKEDDCVSAVALVIESSAGVKADEPEGAETPELPAAETDGASSNGAG